MTVKRVAVILLAVVLMAGKVGCVNTPTPAAPLSSEQEKKFEKELEKKRREEGKSKGNGP